MIRREIVEAGAGCGKTSSLVSRFLEGLLGQPETKKAPLPAKDLVALTFTDDAAEEMRSRVVAQLRKLNREDLVPAVLEESEISTFHSLCYKLLQPHLAELGYPADGEITPSVLARNQRKRWIYSQLIESPFCGDLAKLFGVETVLELGCDFWFESPSLSPETLSLLYEQERKKFEVLQAKLSDSLKQLQNQEPELLEKSPKAWPHALAKLLKDPTGNPSELNFQATGGKVLADKAPELRKQAQVYRELLKKNLHRFMDPKFETIEHDAHAKLFRFLTESVSRGPKILDFEALEREILVLSRKKKLRHSPKLLLVDEFQDTNRSQFEILENISDAETEWFFVGDPKQSIYRFRGADVSLFVSLRDKLTLQNRKTNYRSSESILNFVNEVQGSLFSKQHPTDPPQQILDPANPPPQGKIFQPQQGDVCVLESSQKLDSAQRCALFLKYYAARNARSPNQSHGLLFFTWRDLRNFSAELKTHGIPHRISGADNPFEHHLSRLFFDFIGALSDGESGESYLSKLLERWGSGQTISTAEIRELASGRSTLALLDAFIALFEPSRWERGSTWVAFLAENLRSWSQANRKSAASLEEIRNLFWDNRSKLDQPFDLPGADTQSKNAVVLYTVHGSKGLEFDHVYLPWLREGRRGSDNAVDNEETESTAVGLKLEDEVKGETFLSLFFQIQKRLSELHLESEKRRLLYVALTRAVHSLWIVLEPPQKTRTESDALEFFGVPSMRRKSLSDIFRDAKDAGLLMHSLEKSWLTWSVAEFDPIASSTGESSKTTSSSAIWTLPVPPTPLETTKAQRPFARLGVTQYLEQLHKIEGPTERNFAALTRTSSQDLGTELHAFLERWNGDHSSAESLMRGLLPKSELSQIQALLHAAHQVRALPELKDYWTTLGQVAQSQIRREFGLYVYGDDYRLSGFADALWFKSNEHLVIIDWKSSSSFGKLAKTERLQKIREQMRLYAKPFESECARIDALAIGIEGLGHKTRQPVVDVLLSEVLKS